MLYFPEPFLYKTILDKNNFHISVLKNLQKICETKVIAQKKQNYILIFGHIQGYHPLHFSNVYRIALPCVR